MDRADLKLSPHTSPFAQRYLIPQAQKECGLAETQITTKPEAIGALIKTYCRESGVRNLQKHIEKVRMALFKSTYRTSISSRSCEKPLIRS